MNNKMHPDNTKSCWCNNLFKLFDYLNAYKIIWISTTKLPNQSPKNITNITNSSHNAPFT